MTTLSWSSTFDHSTDVAFRAWGSELQTKFLAAGLTQAADTGQINWTTVTRAGTSADAGFEIYYMTGSLHATAPIYMKVYYGTGGATTTPRIKVEFGTSTNGSGTIGGTAKTAATIVSSGSAILSTTTAYQSFLCVTAGTIALSWKINGQSAGIASAGFGIARTVDTAGALTVVGAIALFSSLATSTAISTQSLKFTTTAQAFTVTTTLGQAFVPGAELSSYIAPDNQAYPFWIITPTIRPCYAFCAVYVAEVLEGTTFSATLVAAVSHTYLSIGLKWGFPTASSVNNTNFSLAILWE